MKQLSLFYFELANTNMLTDQSWKFGAHCLWFYLLNNTRDWLSKV